MTKIQKIDKEFQEILVAIQNAKSRAYSKINKELISLYWNIGRYISEKVEKKLWGKSVVENLANLDKINSANFHLVIAPLKLKNATGSPVRALAFV